MYKIHTGKEVLAHVICVNPIDTQFLRTKVYEVIDETNTNALIRFNSRGAKWYSWDRFVFLGNSVDETMRDLIIDFPHLNNNYIRAILTNHFNSLE